MKDLIQKLKEIEASSKDGKAEIPYELLHTTINTLLIYEKKTVEIEKRVIALEEKVFK